jgi:hypothetical protein
MGFGTSWTARSRRSRRRRRAADGGAVGPEAAAPVRRHGDVAAHAQLEAAVTDADAESWRARAGCAPAATTWCATTNISRRRPAPGRRHDRRRHRAAVHHADQRSLRKAQDEWTRWAEGKVDGHDDFYGFQKTAGHGAVVVGGETLTVWKPDGTGPDGRVEGIEGDQLDESKLEDLARRRAHHPGRRIRPLQRPHCVLAVRPPPGRHCAAGNYQSTAVPAKHVDHVFERTRFGQTRGVSWLAAIALDAKDIGDIEDAVRMQQKVQACVGLFITPGDDQEISTLSADGETTTNTGTGRLEETITPGMIYRGRKGESATPSTRRRPAARSTSSASSWRPFRRRWRLITG